MDAIDWNLLRRWCRADIYW